MRGRPVRVLFLCTGNSARSQMAEGWLRWLSGGRVEVASAGTEPSALHPLAVRVMRERGVDISGQHAKSVAQFLGQRFDWVVTVCARARERCPTLPGARVLHWDLPDPAQVQGTEEEVAAAFRAVRDGLECRVRELLRHLEEGRPRELV